MKNIYTEEIESKGTLDLNKLLGDMAVVRISIASDNPLHEIIATLDEKVNTLIKLIKVQDRNGAIKQWQNIFNTLKTLNNNYFSCLEKSSAQNKVLIDKFKLDPIIEKELLGIVSKSKTGTLNA